MKHKESFMCNNVTWFLKDEHMYIKQGRKIIFVIGKASVLKRFFSYGF